LGYFLIFYEVQIKKKNLTLQIKIFHISKQDVM